MMGALLASLGRMHAVARNTFIEAGRNRAFLGLGIAAVGLVATSIVVSSLALADQRSRVLVDFGLFSIGLLQTTIAIVLGIILVYKEIDRKTFYLVLPKPVRRSEVLAGKFAGLAGILAVSIVVMGLAWILSLLSQGVVLRPDMVKALLLVWMESAVVTAAALFFSSFATPVMSGVFTAGVFLAGRTLFILAEHLAATKGALASDGIARAIAVGALAVLPDLSVFNASRELILDVPIVWDYVLSSFVYCCGYCVFFGSFAMLLFRRRDFV